MLQSITLTLGVMLPRLAEDRIISECFLCWCEIWGFERRWRVWHRASFFVERSSQGSDRKQKQHRATCATTLTNHAAVFWILTFRSTMLTPFFTLKTVSQTRRLWL